MALKGTVKKTADNLKIKKTAAKPKRADLFMYVGPSLSDLGILQNQSWRSRPPERAEKKFDDCPALRRLFIPFDSFFDCRARLKSPGSALSKDFETVKNFNFS